MRHLVPPLHSVLLVLLLLMLCRPSSAEVPPPSPAANNTSPKVEQLLQLLNDPQVQNWLQERAANPAEMKPAAVPSGVAESMTGNDASGYLAQRLDRTRRHLLDIWQALPAFPTELVKARAAFQSAMLTYSLAGIVLLLAAFAALGSGVEWIARRLWKTIRHWLIEFRPASEGDRLLVVLVRLLYGASMVLAFAVGSIGAFLMLDWPPLLRHIILAYLLAFLVIRLALVACRFCLAPAAEPFRLLPMSTAAAWFWYRRVTAFAAWLSIGWATVVVLRALGFAPANLEIVAYTLGIGLLAIAIEASWRRPTPSDDNIAAFVKPERRHHVTFSRHAVNWLLTIYFVVLWLLWVVSAFPSLFTLLILFVLPLAIRLMHRAVRHLLRPFAQEETETTETEVVAKSRSIAAVCLERGLRTLLIVIAALLVAKAWDLDFMAMAGRDTVLTRLTRGIVNAGIILLIGELVWHIAKTMIDHKMMGAAIDSTTTTDETLRRHQRLRTLLPILRNILFIVLLVMVSLMALSALGVEIGPLVAGAGVIGVAIGFGAQTLVKDIISGIFFLLDDAFRIGEYIQSGNYKGTVESFSLRSIKLRHQRGPLYTVPFGSLGAVQNMSRDWVIDKLSINVTYDTDLEKVRKIIKDIGRELASDTEHSKYILEPLKMQGVEQFGDFAIQIRMKMMTKPGEQFVIRRRAFALIKKAFEENGIRFATPTLQVAGGGDETAAAAAAVAARRAVAMKLETGD